MNQEKLKQLFQKYADKTCTQEEFAELMMIFNDDQTKDELDILMDNEWEEHADGPELSHEKKSRLFEQVMAAVAEHKKPLAGTHRLTAYKSWISWIAASVLIGVVALMYYNSDRIFRGKSTTDVENIRVAAVNMTTGSEHKKIKLPDGSTVVLNSKSRLEFPKVFTGERREVTLKGEGYFDIKHNPKKPFIVHTGKITTTVLGTAFNISAYDDDHDVVVTVTRGKVMVQNETKTLGIIVPNQQIVVNKKQMKSSLLPIMAKKIVEWQEKDLFFDEVTMEEAAVQLSAQFNVKIRFASNESKDCRFTATFLKGEGLDEILQVITSFNHTEYRREAGEIIISGKGCK